MGIAGFVIAGFRFCFTVGLCIRGKHGLDGSIGWIDMDGIEHWVLYVYGWDALHCFFVCVLVHHVRLGKEETHSIFGRDAGKHGRT